MTEYKGGMNLSSKLNMITMDDLRYPKLLKEISDPPEIIYYKGNTDLLNKRCIAIVGSRRCSEYGKNVALKIAKQASINGFCVVSGMAIGIDNFAHQGALKVGGDTIAVLGSGVDVCYPKQHMKLYKEISDRGLIISELPYGTEPMPFSFPQRNRIIAGISEAVVVVEARTGSGSLITAELANTQGKLVFAVPGNITSQYSLGTNKLIVEGAQPLTVIDDMFHLLGVSPKVDPEELEALGSDEREIYELVAGIGEIPLDLISAKTGMDPFLVNSVVSVLEIKGYVDYNMGKVIPIKF